MRAQGSAVGVGQVLAAHRALAAVEPRDFRFALRATLCTSPADVARLEAALAVPRGEPVLGAIEREVLPRVSVPDASAGPELALELEAVPAAWSAEEQLRRLDFAEYSDAERAAARRLLARVAARGPSGRAGGRAPAGAAGGRTCGRRPARRCATAASCATGAGGRRASGRGGSC